MFGFKTKSQKKVFVGLSGGVDSAVSAALLKRAGFDVTGVFIRIVLPAYPCPAVTDRQDAMRVAAHLKIPFKEIDLSKEYKDKVFAHTIAEFAFGNTPNPDTLCNREIKFGLFFAYAMKQGADLIATGHYAQTKKLTQGGVELYMGQDANKDQSYFLWMIGKEQLSRTLFPVGNIRKPEVRILAKKFGLPNATRKDSQGLCFLGDISMHDMLTHELLPKSGIVLSKDGQELGVHDGAVLYTLGQRHGFTIEGESGVAQAPMFVIAKNIANNTITVSENQFPKNVSQTACTLQSVNWIGEVINGEYLARYRYRQKLIKATVECANNETRVFLHEPHYVPLGQSLVLYKAKRCVGGGVVDKSTLVLK